MFRSVQHDKFERELGRGGFGAVYLARTAPKGPPLALKVMLSHIAVDSVARSKFLREIKSIRDLRHPRIVEIVGAGEKQGLFYFVTTPQSILVRSKRTLTGCQSANYAGRSQWRSNTTARRKRFC